MNMFVRLSGDVPTIQKTFFRNFFALFIASGAMIKNRCSIILPKGARFDLFMRAACGYAGVVLNFYAIDRLSISDASLLNKMSPFFAIIFSTFLLKERANKVQWAIILTAFIGALFVIKPSFQNAELGASIAGFCGGMCAGAAYTFVRRATGKGVKSYYAAFFFSGVFYACGNGRPVFALCTANCRYFLMMELHLAMMLPIPQTIRLQTRRCGVLSMEQQVLL